MQARDFAYWLQGYFEVSETAVLTKAQAGQILEKARAVSAGPGDVENKSAVFASYAEGILTGVQGTADLAAVTTALKGKLNDLFVHAIDPSLPGDQQQLREKHRPRLDDGGKGGGGLEPMC